MFGFRAPFLGRNQPVQNQSGRSVRVLLAEDSEGHIAMYEQLLREHQDLEYVGVVDNPAQVEQVVAQHQPHVILLDNSFAGFNLTGIELAGRLRKAHRKLGIVLFTRSDIQLKDVHTFMQATQGGSRGVLIKSVDDQADLVPSLRMVARGVEIISPAISEAYDRYLVFENLRPEDRAILDLIADGLQYDAVPKRLKADGIASYEIARRTVEDRVKRIADQLRLPEANEDGDKLNRRVLLINAYRDARSGNARIT
jgi:DNA-binding NarL/FixJ family response regulator